MYVIFLDATTVLSFSPSLVSVVDVFIVILLFLFYLFLLQYFTFQLHRDSFSFRPWLLLRLLKPKTTDMNKLLSVSPCVRADRSAVLQGTFWRCSFLWSRFEIWNIWFTITLSGRGVSYDAAAASLFVLLFMVVKYEFIFWETNKTKWSESPTDLYPPCPPTTTPPPGSVSLTFVRAHQPTPH